jgi:predicted naringenin-chalcone synthase
MSVYINHIVTAVPSNKYDQTFVRDFLKKHIGEDRRVGLAIHHIYKNSGIDSRFSVIPDFREEHNSNGLFFDAVSQTLKTPGTAERNDIYKIEAGKLYTTLARSIIDETPGINPESITHVITVSCTGFYAPGPDLDIVNECGLNPSVQRYHIGFMGCYAAFPALRMAKTIVEADSKANVLIVAVELCTLHLKFKTDADSLISTSVFADGGAAVLVSAEKDQTLGAGFKLGELNTQLVPKGAGDMAWTIGNNGFDMILSSYIPDILSSGIRELLNPILVKSQLNIEAIKNWAIHPGGRAILDKISTELNLDESSIAPSREVLAQYGNMSSATILFVLNAWRKIAPEQTESVIAMAFGPGLTVELGTMDLFQV